MLDKNRFGLAVGLFFAAIHAIWAVVVALIPNQLQAGLDWIFKVHFLEPIWKLTAFNFLNAIFLVIVTFIIGYIFGWLLACLWNWVKKK